jgi:hypothetical protein
MQTPTGTERAVFFTLTDRQFTAVSEAILHALTYDTPRRDALEQAVSAMRWARMLQPAEVELDFGPGFEI